MRNGYYNASHCPDPTAFEALRNVAREERRAAAKKKAKKRPRKKQNRRRTTAWYAPKP